MSKRSEQKKILQKLVGMLVAKLFAHMLKDDTNINDEFARLEVQSLSTMKQQL
jgi:hemerythrin